jgi:hypothetical protein
VPFAVVPVPFPQSWLNRNRNERAERGIDTTQGEPVGPLASDGNPARNDWEKSVLRWAPVQKARSETF